MDMNTETTHAATCQDLLCFWQDKRYWLNVAAAKQYLGLTEAEFYLAIARLRSEYKVKIESEFINGHQSWRLKCTCHLIGGVKDVQNCYVHCEELKLK
jgi:hypothetical protein